MRQNSDMHKSRLAVLPFENLGDDSWSYLAEGLTELAVNTLNNHAFLLVIARESVEQIRGESGAYDLQLRDKLQLDIILTGTLTVEDQLKLEISAWNLTDPNPIWVKTLEADLKQIILFGNDLATFLKKQFSLSDAKESREPVSLPRNRQAYRAYLLGNHYLNKWLHGYTELALTQFEKVVELEPDFIPAYLGIAKATVFLVSRGFRFAEEHYPAVTKTLDQMLLLNPNYGELHIYKGIIEYFYLLDWESAFQNIEKGLKTCREPSEAYAQLSFFWYGMRKYDKALEAIGVAMEYNPLSISLLNMKGDVLISAERYEEASRTFLNILELQPTDKVAMENLMFIGMYENKPQKARKYMRMLKKDGNARALDYPRLGMVYGFLGMKKEMQEVLEEFHKLAESDQSGNHYNRLACVYSSLGDWDKVIGLLEKSFALRNGIIYILTDPLFKPIRNWKRYRKLEQQITYPTSILDEQQITIQSDLKSTLELNPDHLLYVRSEENYSTMVIYNNFRVEEKLLRISLHSLLNQLPENLFFQCHRSYVVNKTLDFDLSGNARGYKLHSREHGFEIPVSRSRIEEMKSIFQ